jgi:hypothetical protein
MDVSAENRANLFAKEFVGMESIPTYTRRNLNERTVDNSVGGE